MTDQRAQLLRLGVTPAAAATDHSRKLEARLREALALLDTIEEHAMLSEMPADESAHGRHENALSMLDVVRERVRLSLAMVSGARSAD